MKSHIEWKSASPLWEKALKLKQTDQFNRPALLCFKSDDFMEELMALMPKDPLPGAVIPEGAKTMQDHLAVYETWQDNAPVVKTKPDHTGKVLKLYQPVHKRYYLVAANVVCHLPGLPDKPVRPENNERVSFVIRRRVQTGPGSGEYQWISSGDEGHWEKLTDPLKLGTVEERLPMFPLFYTRRGIKRCTWAGYIPVGRRESYQAGFSQAAVNVTAADVNADPTADPRLVQLELTFTGALANLLEGLQGFEENGETYPGISDGDAYKVFAFIFYDLALFLATHITPVFENITGGSTVLTGTAAALATFLKGRAVYTAGGGQTVYMAGILNAVYQEGDGLVTGGSLKSGVLTGLSISEMKSFSSTFLLSYAATFKTKVKDALPPYQTETFLTSMPEEVKIAEIDSISDAEYIIRCVYERPLCPGIHPPVVSQTTSRIFRLASFYDPEAPMRNFRIPMPIDTSMEGLKKFPRNMSVLISKNLRKQMEKLKTVTLSALEEKKVKGGLPGPDLGMICSFSIPIVTICALILLMIIVQLLNIVFWWLPLFRICFPVKPK